MWAWVGLGLGMLLAGCAAVAEPASGRGLEQTLRVAVPGTGAEITVRLCLPAGAEVPRLVLINHGSTPNADLRQRQQPLACDHPAAAWFLARGYAVAAPLRRGYGAAGGAWAGDFGPCTAPDYRHAGRETARDIRAAINHLVTLPSVQADGVIVLGHSGGGWGALALAAEPPVALGAIINIAGGRGGRAGGRPNVNCQPTALVASAGEFGATARVPSLWVYTANDSFFDLPLAQRMLEAYRGAGGLAEFHALPAFGSDGHQQFFAVEGPAAWGPVVAQFLAPYPSRR
ncbi:MAG: alpha/beta fold hydrolase [Alphaproteobacteria bacterium]|nr:alpha/beta fold hydrolase [Alphaproteobacteria bacterium]